MSSNDLFEKLFGKSDVRAVCHYCQKFIKTVHMKYILPFSEGESGKWVCMDCYKEKDIVFISLSAENKK